MTSSDKKLNPKIKNLAGQKIGRLKVIEYAGSKQGRATWKCQCDCGNLTIIKGKYLLNGDTSSCGCLKANTARLKKLDLVGEINKDYWSAIKRGAAQRNLEFNITRKYAWNLFLKQNRKCALSGEKLHIYAIHSDRKTQSITKNASLDRIDSSKGYVRGNVQWVSQRINQMKFMFTQEDFIAICKSVNDYQQELINNHIICVSGGMDCLHKGHLRMIKDAAKYGKVIVILNSDAWLTRKKGKPFMEFAERKEILLGIKDVYDVVEVDDSDGTVCEALKRIKPDYFANGGDRKSDNVPEVKLCKELNIKMLWNIGGADKIQSSSWLIENAKD